MAIEELRLDIKDFILISGGLLIAMVIGHGFWIAWRAKREPLRLDIVPDLIPDDVDDMERLRGELPNGGARVVNYRVEDCLHDVFAIVRRLSVPASVPPQQIQACTTPPEATQPEMVALLPSMAVAL